MRRALQKLFNSKRNPLTHRRVLLALTAGAALTFFIQSFQLNTFEAFLYDFRIRHGGHHHLDDHIVLVKIDDQTIQRLNEFSPLSIKSHLALLNEIGKAHPKAIAFLMNFNDSIGPDQSGAAPDQKAMKLAGAFVQTANKLTQEGTPVYLGTDIDLTGEVLPPFPLSKIPHQISKIHNDGNIFSEDKVTRRAWFSVRNEPSLHLELASLITGKKNVKDYRGIYDMDKIDAKYFLINYTGPTQDDLQPFKEVSAIDVLDGKIPPDFLKDKIILIGTQSRSDANDYTYTPYSKDILTNAKLTVHANIIETLIHNKAILKSARWLEIVIAFLLTSLIIIIVFQTKPTQGVLITIICAVLMIVVATVSFRYRGVWVNLSRRMLGIFLAYYLFVPYRLIMEFKKRWQFQKKNEVLIQVEEFKSNFMSLITHDLKTPVARIQGMAEMLEHEGKNKEIAHEIIGSTETLNSFITGVLEVAKIESSHIQLNKNNKDVNQIIEDCVNKFEFQAKAKSIKIITELEPLFPILIDATLITKVISNLIDNAIKYSSSHGCITIQSRELVAPTGFTEIIISDTGYGISSKDIENLFTKFYRVKNDTNMKIKGTGLGLYLSRYVVELHKGRLTVKSIEGKGSIFTILLPNDDMSLNRKQKEGARLYA